MTNIKVTEAGVIPENYAHTGDATLYDNEAALIVATVANEGGHTGQFKVLLKLDGQHVHEEWINDLSANAHHTVTFAIHPHAGQHHLMVVADTTSHVQETEEYFDNVAEVPFDVHVRHVDFDDSEGTVVTGHVTDKQYEKAGWKRATVNVQVWDFLNNPLEDYDVMIVPEGESGWLQPEQQMTRGAARFPHVLVHPSGAIHVLCQARDANANPHLTGVFTATINADQAVVIDAWQDTDIETWADTDLDAKTTQWSVSAKTSVKGGFKILGAGVEASAEVGGTYGRSSTHTSGTVKTHRVLIAKPDLVPQRPQRPI
ncbi:MAG: hypothetical protein QOJ34_3180 [Pseudonocardiales bacterium]|jgi:hypothetical protein|nr:hypothetical protein [Pseudonocardiales bacterium]